MLPGNICTQPNLNDKNRNLEIMPNTVQDDKTVQQRHKSK